MNDQPARRGRPPKEKDAHAIMQAEVVELVELARRTRKFVAEQLDKLQIESKNTTGIKQRLELAKAAAQLMEQVNRTAKAVLAEVNREKTDESEEGQLGKIIEDLCR